MDSVESKTSQLHMIERGMAAGGGLGLSRRLIWFALWATVGTFRGCQAGVGFCIEATQPAALKGTGYAKISTIATQAACSAGGHEWCPLDDTKKAFDHADPATGVVTVGVEYYWYSACCTGTQGARLLVDSTIGKPTCKAGTTAAECTRGLWHGKLRADLIGPSSGYDKQVSPIRTKMNDTIYGGAAKVGCLCTASDPNCLEPARTSDKCLLCRTDEPCNDDGAAVSLSISFFKITSVDLRSSELEFCAPARSSSLSLYCSTPAASLPLPDDPATAPR